jgi:anti-sigma-K factor RskA
MNDQPGITRFQELEAGRILGDLDADELREWEELAKQPGCESDPLIEWTAAAVEVAAHESAVVELSPSLQAKLKEGMRPFLAEKSGEEKVERPSLWKRIFSDTETAWAFAAVFLILFIAEVFVDESGARKAVVAEKAGSPGEAEAAREALVARAPDLIRSEFGGLAEFEEMAGEVIWSDELQEGYLTLSNLPANDPKSRQYQLWIVDPDRDDEPVDGGVFDIPASSGPAVIPIRNPLAVKSPQKFVITLEKPGGVVVSEQEVVVALAQTEQG